MGKSVLTIHKEIEKKEYQKSPLGQLEKRLTKIYDALYLEGKKLPQEVLDAINKIRTENEEWQLEYIKRTNQEHKEAVDKKLEEAFKSELKILEKHLTPK